MTLKNVVYDDYIFTTIGFHGIPPFIITSKTSCKCSTQYYYELYSEMWRNEVHIIHQPLFAGTSTTPIFA